MKHQLGKKERILSQDERKSKTSLVSLRSEQSETTGINTITTLTKEKGFWILLLAAFFIMTFVIVGQVILTSPEDTNDLQSTETSTLPKDCKNKEIMIGDGLCDDVTNVELCFFDGGDCCLEKKSTPLCVDCTCKMLVDQDRLQEDFAKYSINVLVNPSEDNYNAFTSTKEVSDVLDAHVCSLICLDMILVSMTNAWVFNKNGQLACTCGLVCLNDNDLNKFQEPIDAFSNDPVFFVKTDNVNGTFCYDITTKEIDSTIIETTTSTKPGCSENASDVPENDTSNLNMILYTSGVYDGHEVVLDLGSRYSSTPSNCDLKGQSVVGLEGKQQGVGGLLLESKPMYCSGLLKPLWAQGSLWGGQECFTYEPDGMGWTVKDFQITERYETAAIVVHGNTELFVIGGRTDFEEEPFSVTATTEFVSMQQVRQGPPLLKALYATCFVKYNDSHAITIGGFDERKEAVEQTFIYAIDSDTDDHWFEGPPLTIKRGVYHACGSLIDTADDELYVVTLGGVTINGYFQYYDVFEYWKPRENLFEWTGIEERLPEEFYYPSSAPNRPMAFGVEMVGTPGGGSLILFGGDLVSDVFELKVTCGLFEARKTNLQLKSQKYYGAAFLVPDSLVECV